MTAADTAEREDGARRLSVLVVDDDPILRMVLRKLMESLGCDVEEAGDGEAGLRALQSSTDLVLLDLVMPVLGGADACRAIRGGTTNPGVYVCVVSSSTDPASHAAARAAGADDVLKKPVSREQLAEITRRVTARLDG